MYFLLKYRLLVLIGFFIGLGLVLAVLSKLDELQWYYIIGTPVIAAIMGLLIHFLLLSQWFGKLKERSLAITIVFFILFFVSFLVYLLVYINGTFQYEDIHGIKRTYIKGYTYTEIASQYKKENPGLVSDAELLYDGFGGISGKNDVWTPGSIRRTTFHLTVSYCFSVLFLSALLSWILGIAYQKRYAEPQKLVQEILDQEEESNLEKYLLTFNAKKDDERYKLLKFHIFISYASTERDLAEAIFYALANSGHMVFFDRTNLPPGLEYNRAIHAAIMNSDIFIFLVSPTSVTEGHYTLSELKFAAEKWPAASGALLPVMCVATPFDQIPAYVQSVSILIPKGNIATEVTAEIEKLYDQRRKNPITPTSGSLPG